MAYKARSSYKQMEKQRRSSQNNFAAIRKLITAENEVQKTMLHEYNAQKNNLENEKGRVNRSQQKVKTSQDELQRIKLEQARLAALLVEAQRAERAELENLEKEKTVLAKHSKLLEELKQTIVPLETEIKKHQTNLNFYKFQSNLAQTDPQNCDLWFLKSEECSVCTYVKPITGILACKHTFCTDCIKRVKNSNMPTCPLCRVHINGFNAFDVEAMRFYTENDIIPDRAPRDEPEALPVSNRDLRVRVPTTSSNVVLLSSSEDEEEPSTIPTITIPSSQDAYEIIFGRNM